MKKLIQFSLSTFHELKYVHLPESLARIAFSYLPIAIKDINLDEGKEESFQESKALTSRVDYELTKKEYPEDIADMASFYPEISQWFPHHENLVYSQDEARIVLSYLAKYPKIVDVAMNYVHADKTKPVHADKPKIDSAFASVTAFFGKKTQAPQPKPMECMKKLEDAKQAISTFVRSENWVLEEKQESMPRTFLQLKQFYQERNNDKRLMQIASLEKNLEQANTEYMQESLKLIVQSFGNTKKTPWKSVKSMYQARQLQTEAKQFGYECRDTAHDGDCFFHAIADQLALQGLTALGSSAKELRGRAMNYILNHLDDYRDFLDQHDGDINDFIGQNIDMGTWADHLIISALSRALNSNIVIIRSDGAAPTICKRTQPITTLYLGHEVGQHYQSLVENKAIQKTKFLQPYVDTAINDATEAAASNDAVPVIMKLGT